jgi:hypothetical protein
MYVDQLEFEELSYLIDLVQENLNVLLCNYDFSERDFVPKSIRNQYNLSESLLARFEARRADISR